MRRSRARSGTLTARIGFEGGARSRSGVPEAVAGEPGRFVMRWYGHRTNPLDWRATMRFFCFRFLRVAVHRSGHKPRDGENPEDFVEKFNNCRFRNLRRKHK